VIQRRTQTGTYWQQQFSVTSNDLSRVYDMILDKGTPLATADLTRAVIDYHCRREEESIQAELSKGSVYQPKSEYKVGEQIIFPAFDYALGTVVGSRPGRNPEYGQFTVIQVQVEGEDEVREFASSLEGEHKLDFDEGETDLLASGDLLSVPELVERYGSFVEERLISALSNRNDFIAFGDKWFLRDLLLPISKGNRNIAEALIEIKSRPLTTAEFLPDLDLPTEVSEEIQLLSLSCALDTDERFDNVGDSGREIWYLRRLTPEPVVKPPERLQLKVASYDRQAIDESLLLIEREIDDEGSGEEVLGASRPLYRTSLTLIYPHWRAGTLPLTVRTRGLFPTATTHHSPVVLIDGQSGDRMQGWVVHGSSFVYGVGDWYGRYKLPVGALIKLERTRDPRVITVDFEARRLKSLWVPVAAVQAGKLIFQMRKMAIACEYDEKMVIGEDNAGLIDRLWSEVAASGESLLQTMVRIMPALMKLSPQETVQTVHAKTIYSAVNVLRRSPPGPIFALLSTEPAFVAMGGGYWTFDETMV
jgi:hypothetical protein